MPSGRRDCGLPLATRVISILVALSNVACASAGSVIFSARRRHGKFLTAIEALRGEGRTLRQFSESTVDGEASPLAENDLMDPDHVPRSLTRSVQRWLEHLNER